MLRYLATVQKMYDDTLGEFGTSGVVMMEGETVLDELKDVSPDCAEVNRLVELLNRNEVSRLHFRDVVEDFLAAD